MQKRETFYAGTGDWELGQCCRERSFNFFPFFKSVRKTCMRFLLIFSIGNTLLYRCYYLASSSSISFGQINRQLPIFRHYSFKRVSYVDPYLFTASSCDFLMG
jgi:hypothetical protein